MSSYWIGYEVHLTRSTKCQECGGRIVKGEYHLVMLKYGTSKGRVHRGCVQNILDQMNIAQRKYDWTKEMGRAISSIEVTV